MLVPGLTITGGKVSTTASAGQAANFISSGIGFMSDGSLALDTAAPSGTTFEAGLRINTTGAIFATTTTSGSDAWLGGLRRASTGALVIEAGAATQVVNGTPLTANGVMAVTSAGASGDPFFNSVTALLHMDGTNGSTTFTDQIGHIFTRSGTSQAISTAAPKFGTGACQNTVNDTTNVSSSSIDFGTTGAFTYEGWARNLGVGTNGVIISMAGTTNYGFFHVFTTGAVSFNDSASHATGFNLTVDGLYHHFAISSAGAGLAINAFIDGNAVYTGIAPAGAATNTLLPSGGNANLGIGGMLGYIDDVRFTKGINRYTGNFTPPTAPFPDSL